MSSLDQLKAAKGLTDVAQLVGFSPTGLAFVLYKKTPDSNYHKFEIPKRHGGNRQISAPEPQLKLIQRRLADLLQDCAEQVNVKRKFPDTISHGFKRKRSIVTNANRHRRRRFVFNVDLKDFFASINFGRVRGYFIKNRDFALDERVATILAKIACYENGLPQGSPCSPIVSNLVAHVMDVHLARLATGASCAYTRYADDLTFSTNRGSFPDEIAVLAEGSSREWLAGSGLLKIVDTSGFELNAGKTRMQYRDSRQEVTGLIVNRKLNVRREYRHTTRAMVHRLITAGSFELAGNAAQPGTNNQLHGMLGFVDEIDRYNQELDKRRAEARGKKLDNSKLSSKESIYRRFILFTYLWAAPMPVIICEGPTDNIYLLHAIRALAADFPMLATMDAAGKTKLLVRLLKYVDRGTGRVLRVSSGGSANLCKLIRTYHAEKGRFHGPSGNKQPIMILVDNDSGGRSVFATAGEVSRTKPTGAEPFVHITANMYLVPTPGQPSKIEDCFDDASKGIVIDGKKFDDGNGIETDTHYGKKVFAHQVVVKQSATINFSGFKPLLERIAAVIAAHQEKLVTAEEMKGLQPPTVA